MALDSLPILVHCWLSANAWFFPWQKEEKKYRSERRWKKIRARSSFTTSVTTVSKRIPEYVYVYEERGCRNLRALDRCECTWPDRLPSQTYAWASFFVAGTPWHRWTWHANENWWYSKNMQRLVSPLRYVSNLCGWFESNHYSLSSWSCPFLVRYSPIGCSFSASISGIESARAFSSSITMSVCTTTKYQTMSWVIANST